MKHYDLVVVGSGVAAKAAAFRVREAGWSVAVIDQQPFGGTCQLRGCDPKRVLMGAAEAADFARRLGAHGLDGAVCIDWPELMAFKRRFTDPVPEETEHSLAEKGIDALHGTARFTGPDRLSVNGAEIEAGHLVLASGAQPRPMNIPGAEFLTTSDAFMALDALPERVVMVGGGYIAAEFSHLAARAGAKVTVLQHGPRMLTHFEPELVDWLMPRFADIGIDVRTQSDVTGIERNGGGYLVHAKQDGQTQRVEADLVVHAAGRVPALDALDLAAAEVEQEDGRLKLNEHLQSVSNARVYAAGDSAAKGPPLTPVASLDAGVVAGNLLDGNRYEPDYTGVPSVAFTIPPIASVGLSEEAARKQGLRFDVRKAQTADWYSARRVAEPAAGYKTLIEQGSDRILGAHVLGPEASETINIFALAIRQKLTADDLKSAIFAYPTAASDISSML
ncbi:MAG TPA: NAD(P)/FAD-dependent oxidoreductase [Pseudolabrys sp.]|nr:NAD(P)/FAD-dependent oxidoreductase [Pseudolabrys sp.]